MKSTVSSFRLSAQSAQVDGIQGVGGRIFHAGGVVYGLVIVHHHIDDAVSQTIDLVVGAVHGCRKELFGHVNAVCGVQRFQIGSRAVFAPRNGLLVGYVVDVRTLVGGDQGVQFGVVFIVGDGLVVDDDVGVKLHVLFTGGLLQLGGEAGVPIGDGNGDLLFLGHADDGKHRKAEHKTQNTDQVTHRDPSFLYWQ